MNFRRRGGGHFIPKNFVADFSKTSGSSGSTYNAGASLLPPQAKSNQAPIFPLH